MSSNTRKIRTAELGRSMTIKIGDQAFVLYETEVLSEPNCVFVKFFREFSAPTLNVDPYLFSLIHAHLKGYEILPLPHQGVPYGGATSSGASSARTHPYLSEEATLKNLLRDATDFGLTNLVAKIRREMVNQADASNEQPNDEDRLPKSYEMPYLKTGYSVGGYGYSR